MFRADITMKQVEAPFDRKCASGHIAPEKFKIDDKLDDTRFFMITNNHGNICGIYCEPCLIIANHFADRKRKYGI